MAPTTQVQLFLSGTNLPRLGPLRQYPDTFAQVALIPADPSGASPPIHLGTTEVVHRSSAPRWTKVMTIDYEYGTPLNFFVDVLSGRNEKSVPRSLGGANFEVGDVLGSRNHTKAKRLRHGGCVFAHVEACRGDGSNSDGEASANLVEFQFGALRLDYKAGVTGALLRSEPNTFFEISRQSQTPSGVNWIVVYRSNPVLESLKPTWDRGELDIHSLCDSDIDRPLHICVFASKRRGNNVPIGSFETNLRALIEKAELGALRDWHGSTFALRKDDYKAYDEVGKIAVIECSITDRETGTCVSSRQLDGEDLRKVPHMAVVGTDINPRNEQSASTVNMASLQETERPGIPTVYLPQPSRPRLNFADYVDGGICDIDLCVAIDFTGSNGDPRIPGTLHYNGPDGSLNDYEETILSVGSAVARYSSTRQFPVWGFGAKYDGQVRHIFQCGNAAAANDVSGVLEAYRQVFESDLTMSGPTNLNMVIQAAAARAQRFHAQESQEHGAEENRPRKYCVLLILTDGIVSDMAATRSKLAAVCQFPLSVVVVGIGMADFSAMSQLTLPVSAEARPNVSFVSFRPHQHDPQSLSKTALRDIPRQIVQYFVNMGIYPQPKSNPQEHGHEGRNYDHPGVFPPSSSDSVISELSGNS